ncbi:MAG: glycosyltransferase family 2 protein [Ignavibacteria bacterium]|nr:glycosyltransferase family 2 protein [Ignavibacteria bacterium]
MQIFVIIPAINEEKSIGKVLDAIPKNLVKEIIVVDNGSSDNTIDKAAQSGSTVLSENKKGYGNACLKGMDYLFKKYPNDKNDNVIIVFLDGDYSDFPEEMNEIVEPITEEDYDMVIGSRILGMKKGMTHEGALLPQALFGNWLSTKLIKLIWNYSFTDLGPFRAVKISSLKKMNMNDKNYGWTVEMQIKAAKLKMKCLEIPVSYRKRIGESKVTGTVSGSVKAGVKILWVIFVSIFKKNL